MEEEARAILKRALIATSSDRTNLYDSIRRRFESLGGVDLPEVPREAMRKPPDFSE